MNTNTVSNPHKATPSKDDLKLLVYAALSAAMPYVAAVILLAFHHSG